MIPNRFTKRYTAAQQLVIDQALDALLEALKDEVVLTAQEKSRVVKMPDAGWGFVENMKATATEQLELLPRKYDDAEFTGDVDNTKVVRGWVAKMGLIADKLDSLLLLGESDCFATALFVRRQLKGTGASEGLDTNLDEGLRHFFDRSGDDTPPTPAPAPKP